MSRVREVIELLTKVFQDNGIVTVKAECFRAAKFDKNEMVIRFVLEDIRPI